MTKQLASILSLVLIVGTVQARITGTPPTNADVWCAGPSGAEVCVDASGNVIPTTDNDADLGTSALRFKDLYVAGTLTLAAGAIDTAKIGTDAVTGVKILNATIDSSKLATASIDTTKIGTDAVTTVKLINLAVDTAKLATDAVTTAKLINSAVDTAKLATDAVTTAKILTAAVDTAKLATDSVSTAKIVNGAVDTNKLAGLGDVPSVGQILCVKASNQIGYCTGSFAAGICTCN